MVDDYINELNKCLHANKLPQQGNKPDKIKTIVWFGLVITLFRILLRDIDFYKREMVYFFHSIIMGGYVQ